MKPGIAHRKVIGPQFVSNSTSAKKTAKTPYAYIAKNNQLKIKTRSNNMILNIQKTLSV